jgi:ribonuclease M5
MDNRIRIPYPIFVEGKYDRLRLLSVVDADIYVTDGFGIFNKKEKGMLLRSLAKKTKIIVLTDSDGAGKVIRSHIASMIPKEAIIPLYIPQIEGVEKRKDHPSKEGFLGVEGMERDLLCRMLLPYAEQDGEKRDAPPKRSITKTDLYFDGLTGGEDSSIRRDALADRISLPRGMTPNALLAALNVLLTYREYLALVGRDPAV